MKISSLFAFLIAVLSSSLSYSILILTKDFLGEDIKNSDLIYAQITISVITFILFIFLIKKFGWLLAKNIYKDEINEDLGRRLKNENNIINIYPNMDACLDKICQKLATEKNISIFVQIGREILSGKGTFYDCLKRNESPSSIRILHSSVKTPYLSSTMASSRAKGKLEEWQSDLVSSEQRSKQLSNLFKDGVFTSRAHHEGYYWRIFLFDETCFVQPYVYRSDNSNRSPVFELKRNESSVFNTFESFFNNKWVEYEPNTYYINDLVKEASPVSVTALLRFESLYIFAIPKRYINKNTMYIQAVGGKTENNETYKSALIREVGEEIDASIKIYSSSYTTYIHEGGIQFAEAFHDDPAPLIIYNRDVSEDTRDKRIKWVLLFEADLLINSLEDLKPKNENEAIICLSREMLMKLSDPISTLKIKDIINSKDGSRIITKSSRMKYPSSMSIHPRGMVNSISVSSSPLNFNA